MELKVIHKLMNINKNVEIQITLNMKEIVAHNFILKILKILMKIMLNKTLLKIQDF